MKYAKIGLSSVLLVTLAFSAIAYAAAQQQNDHDFSVEYEFTIGASPDGVQKASAEDGLFNQPYDVEINNNGEIFVSDYQNHRIQKFKSDGSFLTNWGGFGTGNGQMAWPAGLAFDWSQNLYVSEQGYGPANGNRIQKFNSDGEYLANFGADWEGRYDALGRLNTPYDIVVLDDFTAFISDTHNARIQEWNISDSPAEYSPVIKDFGDGEKFSYPRGMAKDSSNNIYVVDSVNSRILKFNPSMTTLLDGWGGKGTGDNQFNEPYGIAVEGDLVVVGDTGNNRVSIFDTDGNFLYRFGSQGGERNQFWMPRGVAVDSGRIYVADSLNHRVQVYIMDGQQTNNGPEQGGQEPVQEPPSPGIPVAQINAAGPYVPGNPIKFDGSKSTDSDGEIVKYHWDFGDDSTADTAIVEHTYTRQGNFIVKLTATDNDNNSAEKTLEIRVSDTDNPRPEAVIVAIGPFEPGKPITLDGTDSRDPDGGEIASYEWGYGNTQKGTGSKVSYTFPEPGTYTISLRVTDDDGLTSSVVIKDIEVKAPDLMPLYTILGIAIAAGLGIATLWQNRRKKSR